MVTKRPDDRSPPPSTPRPDTTSAPAGADSVGAAEVLDLGSVLEADGDSADGWAAAVMETDPSDTRQWRESKHGWHAIVAPELVEDDSGDSEMALNRDDDAKARYDRLMAEDDLA